MKDRLNALTGQVIGAAIAVHKALGPGLLESAYQACLLFELAEAGLNIERQKPVPLIYRGVVVDCAYRMDIVVNQEIVIEVKAVEKLDRVHDAQLLSYLKLSGCKVGLLINFNVRWLVDSGIKRLVNDFPDRSC
jgi:GxxExxY protein